MSIIACRPAGSAPPGSTCSAGRPAQLEGGDALARQLLSRGSRPARARTASGELETWRSLLSDSGGRGATRTRTTPSSTSSARSRGVRSAEHEPHLYTASLGLADPNVPEPLVAQDVPPDGQHRAGVGKVTARPRGLRQGEVDGALGRAGEGDLGLQLGRGGDGHVGPGVRRQRRQPGQRVVGEAAAGWRRLIGGPAERRGRRRQAAPRPRARGPGGAARQLGARRWQGGGGLGGGRRGRRGAAPRSWSRAPRNPGGGRPGEAACRARSATVATRAMPATATGASRAAHPPRRRRRWRRRLRHADRRGARRAAAAPRGARAGATGPG